jgi:hypothetical protein
MGTCRLIGRFYFWSRVVMTMFTKDESVALERAGRLDQVCMCQGNPLSIRCRLAKGEPVLKSRKLYTKAIYLLHLRDLT